jgi:serine protease Do
MNKHNFQFIVIALLAGILLGSTFTTDYGNANILDSIKNFFRKETEIENSTSTISNKTVEKYKPAIDYENAVIKAVEENTPSVVSIVITKDIPVISNNYYYDNFFFGIPPEFRDFFGYEYEKPKEKTEEDTEKTEVGGGTGFIVSSDGLIVTNKHVVFDEDAQYTVLTNDGESYEAKVIAKDPAQDIAILKIEAENLKPAKLGDSNTVKIGQTAIAIGNSLGEFRNTVSVGVVSGLSRSITASGGDFVEKLDNVIQTDAAINTGNSGGPLLNLKGEVIGMNTAIAEGAQNIGFAIPVNRIKRDIDSVKENGKIEVPFLGVRYRMITPEFAENQNLSIDYGALIRGSEDGPAVFPNSSADKAGLRAEDIIIEVNNKKVSLDQTLGQIIEDAEIGDEINLKVLRNGKEIEIKATLEERPEL